MRKRLAVVGLLITMLVLVGCPQNGPTLASVLPNVIMEGAPDTQLHLKGSRFANPVSVIWNSKTVLATTLVDSNDLVAIVPASLLKVAGQVTVFAAQGTGGNLTATASLSITIGNVAPTLTGSTPAHAIVGSPTPVTVTLTGTNFNASSVANWNGTAVPTTLVSATSLTAAIPASDFATAGVGKLTVSNAGTGGGTSTSINFTVVAQLIITTASLPGGNIGVAYTATLAASGGTAPYTWSLLSGTLPVGLSLNASTGVISGTPTAAGSSSFSVQVTDTTGALARRRF